MSIPLSALTRELYLQHDEIRAVDLKIPSFYHTEIVPRLPTLGSATMQADPTKVLDVEMDSSDPVQLQKLISMCNGFRDD